MSIEGDPDSKQSSRSDLVRGHNAEDEEESLLDHLRYISERSSGQNECSEDDKEFRSRYSARMNSTLNNYEEYIHDASLLTSLLISRNHLRHKIPYETWAWFTYEERQPALHEYIMHQEIDYLLKLFGFPVTRETILANVTVEKWKSMITLYRKTSAIWIIAVYTRAQYYYETLNLERMKPSIHEALQRLDGVLYDYEYEGIYNVKMLEEPLAYEVVYWGICILRARQGSGLVPIQNEGELMDAIMNHGMGENRAITLAMVKLACFHENLLKTTYTRYEDRAHLGYLDTTATPSHSAFNEKLSQACSEAYMLYGSNFWFDACHIARNDHKYRPRYARYSLQSLRLHDNNEYYFHPRHSENPDDHYRFLHSTLPLYYGTVDVGDKGRLFRLFSRMSALWSQKTIVTQELLDKQEMFADVHQELLFSPNLPIWFHNDYRRSKEHFESMKSTNIA